MWCKGYPAASVTDPSITFAELANGLTAIRNDLGFSGGAPYVDVKLMASLLSMDAYKNLNNLAVREVQQWFNRTYTSRRNFAIVPTDGIVSRQVQTALLYALQFELGMSDDTANGNFGPGTREGLRTHAVVRPGDADTSKRFVHLFQAALRFAGEYVAFDGMFADDIEPVVTRFQSFLELPTTGYGDFATWCSLLVSCGDADRPVSGFDTSVQLANSEAHSARAAGYTHVGRYTVGAGKFITSRELADLKDSGLMLFPIHQRYNNSDAEMTQANGRTQAIEALERCRALNLPPDSTVYFAVDYDPTGDSIRGPVYLFFQAIKDTMDRHTCGKYRIGVYGSRNTCQYLSDHGLVTASFVAGASWGWSGNLGFPMPDNWNYNQIKVDIPFPFGSRPGTTAAIDNVVVSSDAAAVSLASVTPPPVERELASGTGFDVVYEWAIQAEAACERSLSDVPLMSAFSSRIYHYILSWLRKPMYWAQGTDNWLSGNSTPQNPTR